MTVKEIRTANDDYKNYEIKKRESKSFHFTPNGRWMQSYVFTWVEGFFIMSGDMGEMVMQHASFSTFEEGMSWIAGSIHSRRYFMEKVQCSNWKEEYNSDLTIKSLIETLEQCIDEESNEEDIDEDFKSEIIELIARHSSYYEGELADKGLKELVEIFKAEVTDLEQEEVVDIDCELIVCDYNWDSLNYRLSAIEEFANKMLKQIETVENINIKIEIPEEHKDKYVLCATPEHGYAYNSLKFWGKNNSGYYPNINKCQLYTKDEVMKYATPKEDIPIKLADLVNYLALHAEHAGEVLHESEKHIL